MPVEIHPFSRHTEPVGWVGRRRRSRRHADSTDTDADDTGKGRKEEMDGAGTRRGPPRHLTFADRKEAEGYLSLDTTYLLRLRFMVHGSCHEPRSVHILNIVKSTPTLNFGGKSGTF
jgi:hypothetical protein